MKACKKAMKTQHGLLHKYCKTKKRRTALAGVDGTTLCKVVWGQDLEAKALGWVSQSQGLVCSVPEQGAISLWWRPDKGIWGIPEPPARGPVGEWVTGKRERRRVEKGMSGRTQWRWALASLTPSSSAFAASAGCFLNVNGGRKV